MRCGASDYFPVLRRSYKNEESLAAVINRSSRYVRQRLNYPDKYRFTETEMRLICNDLRTSPLSVFYVYSKSGGHDGSKHKEHTDR